MAFKTPAINRQGPTAPAIARTSPSPVRYYATGTQGDVAGGPFGGIFPPPCVGVYVDVYSDIYTCTT